MVLSILVEDVCLGVYDQVVSFGVMDLDVVIVILVVVIWVDVIYCGMVGGNEVFVFVGQVYLLEWFVVVVEEFWVYDVFNVGWLDEFVVGVFVFGDFGYFGFKDGGYEGVVVIEEIGVVVGEGVDEFVVCV